MNKGNNTLNLRASVRFGIYTDGKGKRGVHVTMVDEDSNCVIAYADLPGDEAIADLFSNREAHGEVEVYPNAREMLGLKHENKTVFVKYVRDGQGNVCSKACDQAEKDNPGWIAMDHYRKENHHHIKNGTVEVALERWVKK